MRLNDSYDWIVLGDHPGALLSASLVAKLGHSVLILPLIPGQGQALTKSGQYVDLESNYLAGFGRYGKPIGLLGDCLKRLGTLPSELDLFFQDPEICQVITPDHRVVLTTDDDAFLAEWVREFGKEFAKKTELASAIKYAEQEYMSYWMNLPSRLTITPDKTKRDLGPMNLNQVRKKLSRGLKSGSPRRVWVDSDEGLFSFAKKLKRRELTEVLTGLLSLGTGTFPQPDTPLNDFFSNLVLARTASGFKGGMAAYRSFLIRMAERAGAHVAPRGVCRRVFIEKGKFTGVQVANRGNVVAGGAGILGCSLAHAREFFTVSGRGWFGGLKNPPKPIGWKFTIALTVRTEAIPPGMLKRTLWQEPGGPTLEIEIANPDDYNLREPENRIIFGRTLLPFTSQGISVDYQRVVASRMLRQIQEIMPFLEFHLVRMYPAVRENESPMRMTGQEPHVSDEVIVADELSEVYSFASPEVIPENLRCFSSKGVGSRSGIDGLLVATGESYPEQGALGPTIAAFEAVAWLAHKSGLPGPLN